MVNLSAGDLKWLRAGAARSARRSETMLASAAVAYLCLTGFFLWLSARCAPLAGLTLGQAWREWAGGLSPGRDYSGVYLNALGMLDGVAVCLLFTAVFVVAFLACRADHRRRTRLLASVEGAA